MCILKAYMPGCKGRSFTLQSPKTGSPGRSGCDSRWDLSHRVHQPARKAVFILATCKKEILKADITRRVCSHINSRNKEARQFTFLLKKLSTYGQMFLWHSSLQVRKHWRKQAEGPWSIAGWGRRDLVFDLPVPHRNHCELEYILWNLIEHKRLVAVASSDA